MLIRRATRLDGTQVDIRVGATIEEARPHLEPRKGEQVLDAAHGTVIPGLHDHHIHLRAAAAAAHSVRVGPPHAHGPDDVARLLAAATVGADGWIRAIGYHDSVAGPLDRAALDALSPPAPVRVQHRSGALWVLNSAALDRVGLAEHPDGRFLRGDEELVLPEHDPSLRQISARWCSLGITGITDATPNQSRSDLEAIGVAHLGGELLPRPHCLAPAGIDDIAGLTIGPAKRILDDDTLDLDGLQRWMIETHEAGRAVAVHCVTDSQLVVTLAALAAAGTHPGDRIEHAAMVPDDCIDDLAVLGITVVTQPNFVAERGDEYLLDVPAEDHDRLWRVASLVRGGVAVALSTDTPFGEADPWAAMRAAVRRESLSGKIIGAAERISSSSALSGFLGHPAVPTRQRSVAAGQPGDLCVLAEEPAGVLEALDAAMVTATIIGGRVVYEQASVR